MTTFSPPRYPHFVSFYAAGFIGLAVIGPLIYGSLIEPELLQIRRYEIPIHNLVMTFESSTGQRVYCMSVNLLF